MYPQIEILGITIYTFGLALSISFILFFFMLYKLSEKFGINANFFLGNVLWFFLSMFVFSRLFYIVAEWRDFQFLWSQGILKFLLMSDYNFSLMGGILGFMVVLLFQLKRFMISSRKYIDAIVLAFLFASIIGFIGAFFGGQIYGRPTDSFMGIAATSDGSNTPYTSPMFPLALLYSFVSFFLFFCLYLIRKFTKIEGLVGYIGILLFSIILFSAEFYSGGTDIFKAYVFFNLNQIGSVFLFFLGAHGLHRIYKEV
ncbi:MAG: prolipoprotein diacylglyceryl transferase [Candidatus Gracilibacteria bacterium]|nr:prolipoprotein diacylglyceryl transferase [Candidatus Gracilibacteria bacterium]